MKIIVDIKKVERLNNSYYGNPNWNIFWYDAMGDLLFARTMDNSCGYTIDYNTHGLHELEFTRAGRIRSCKPVKGGK